MKKIFTLFCAMLLNALLFSSLFAVFDVGKAAANSFDNQTVQTAAKYSPMVKTETVNFGNRPRTVEINHSPFLRAVRNPGVKYTRRITKYGFRLSHKNYYPPEIR